MRFEGPHEVSVHHSLHRFTQTAFIILSIVLHKQLVNVIGLKLPRSEWSLPDLGTGMTTASHHDGGKQPDSQTWLYTYF